MKEAIKIIKSLNIKDKIIIGVSSGPDSMCLLDILIKNHYNLVVAHINYHRRKESNTEAKYLEEYCYKNKIPFELKDFKKQNNNNFQQEARKFRYDFFYELALKYKTNYIMTAHHGDDLIETILMRLSRGSNFGGYIGFKEITQEKNFFIIRPLIKYSKEEIIEYNKANDIKYYIDSSNLSNDYTRNRFRHKIIPLIKEENPKTIEKYYSFSKMLIEYEDYFNKETTKILDKIYDKYLDLNQFLYLDRILQQRIIEAILKKIYIDDINLVGSKNVTAILKLIFNKKPNKIILLPNQLLARKSYDKLFFEFEKKKYNSYEYILENVVKINDHGVIKLTKKIRNNSNNFTALNSKQIKLPLIIRNRRQGDKITLKNLGTKKIKDILINDKINLIERDNLPVVVDSNDNVVWIPGIRKSIFDNQDDYDIILEYINEREIK